MGSGWHALTHLDVVVDKHSLEREIGEEKILLLPAKATHDGIGLLEEQENGACLPGVRASAGEGENEVTGGDAIIALPDEIEGVEATAGEQVVDEILVDGAEATN
jgi:hypothetical protein